MESNEWKKYINGLGELNFPEFLYKTLSTLMKTSLDLGTMVCQDQNKLRAYKEQIKSAHKQKWNDIASVLASFDLIEPCVCKDDEFCRICGGSRFVANSALSATTINEVGVATSGIDPSVKEKLEAGMVKALSDVKEYRKLSSIEFTDDSADAIINLKDGLANG